MCRSFDNLFKDLRTLGLIHNRFIVHYNHVDGGVKASNSLLNSYYARKCPTIKEKVTDDWTGKAVKGARVVTYDKGLFSSDKVVDFINSRFDQTCIECI